MVTRTGGIRRWALLTVALYVLTLAVLAGPLVLTVIYNPKRPADFEGDLKVIPEMYAEFGFWAVVAGLGLAQAFFLLAPIQVARERPVRRARWTAMAVAAGFMMALLGTALLYALFALVKADKMEEEHGWAGLVLGLGTWVAWAILFSNYSRDADPRSALRRVAERLLVGSIAELLVAVPVHVHVRRRDDCCAHGFTFAGMATGLAVLLFAFGPGVFFLFLKRARDRRPRPEPLEAPVPPAVEEVRR